MDKAKLITGLEMVLEALKADDTTTSAPAAATEGASVKKPLGKTNGAAGKVGKPEAPAKTEEKAPAKAAGDAPVDVDGMSYNDLKKYAQSIGIKAVGTADQIRAKVKEALAGGAPAAADETPAEKAPAKTEKSGKVVPISNGKKAGGLKPKAKEPEMDELEKKVRAEAEEMDVEDISELLLSVGVKKSGDKEVLLKALVQAVRDGKIDFGDDEEGESGETAGEAPGEAGGEEAGEHTDFTQYHAEYDPDGLNDPNIITNARSEAIVSMIDSELASIEGGETSEKDIRDFLETMLTEEQLESYNVSGLDEDELLFLYFEVNKALIDDDGDIHEPNDPYVINDINVCCGHALKYDEENDQYICEACGQTYNA